MQIEKSPVALCLRILRLWCRQKCFGSRACHEWKNRWITLVVLRSDELFLGLPPGLLIGFVTEPCTCSSCTPVPSHRNSEAFGQPQPSSTAHFGILVSHHLGRHCRRYDPCCPHVVERVRIGIGGDGHAWHTGSGTNRRCLRPYLGQRVQHR